MITLKNVKIYEALSEETLCFTATVYENGKRIGTAKNEGHGGNTFVYLDNPRSKTMAEELALEDAVDEAVYAIDKAKQEAKIQKKLERDCVKSVCVGWVNEHGASYYKQGFKGNPALADIAVRKGGLEAIQRMVDRIKSEIKGDESILNTNLGALGVKL